MIQMPKRAKKRLKKVEDDENEEPGSEEEDLYDSDAEEEKEKVCFVVSSHVMEPSVNNSRTTIQ
jgi:hypothetical protein